MFLYKKNIKKQNKTLLIGTLTQQRQIFLKQRNFRPKVIKLFEIIIKSYKYSNIKSNSKTTKQQKIKKMKTK